MVSLPWCLNESIEHDFHITDYVTIIAFLIII